MLKAIIGCLKPWASISGDNTDCCYVLPQVTLEEGTAMVTETTEVQETVVETDADKPTHGEELNNEAIETVSSSSTHREEAAADSEDVTFQSETLCHDVPKVASDLEKITGVEGSGHILRYEEVQTNASGDKATREMEAEPKTGHGAAQTVQHAVTVTESDTTEASCDDVCLGCVVMVSVIVNTFMNSYHILGFVMRCSHV